MAVFETLTPAERARQLANPEGAVGLAVADWLNENNQQANAKTVALLDVKSGNRVLEIGFGNGRIVPGLIGQAADVHYAGIDISPTMVAAATAFNADLVAAGRASFHLGSAERLSFADHSFDRVFSIGVIHFWTDPAGPLAELRRVLRPGGSMLMVCLAPRDAPDFAQPEYGFHLRDAATWDALCRAAGFADVHVETIESQQITPSGAPIKRFGITVRARS
ncbi:MAG: class I SAM-dependent methyltransferase [Devosia sp.]|nr:class I SAM-dependent methyltransferase [Devosia sp.]